MIARRRRSLGALLDHLAAKLVPPLRAYPTREDRGGTDDPTSGGRYWRAADAVTDEDGRTTVPAHDPVSLSWGQVDPAMPAPWPEPRRGGPVLSGPEVERIARRHLPSAGMPAASPPGDPDPGQPGVVQLEAQGRDYAAVRELLVIKAWAAMGTTPWRWLEGPTITAGDVLLSHGELDAPPSYWQGTATIGPSS